MKVAQARFKADPSFTNLLAVQTLLQQQTRNYFASRPLAEAPKDSHARDTGGSSADGDSIEYAALDAIKIRLRAEEEERESLNAEQEIVVEQLRVAEERNILLEQQLEATAQKAGEAAAASARYAEDLAAKKAQQLQHNVAESHGNVDVDMAWGDGADDPLD